MQVTVVFLGVLRDQVGGPSLAVELPAAATYRDLLDCIASAMQSSLAAWGWDKERQSFSRQMLVSRNLKTDLRDETTPLADGDKIFVVPALAGG